MSLTSIRITNIVQITPHTSHITEGKMNLQNSNQGSMKRLSFLSTISILILNIEETLFKTVH